MKTTIISSLQEHAKLKPDKTAFIFLANGETESERLSYAELDRRARLIAGNLQSQCQSGDRVLLCYPPGLEFICAFMGCLYAGMVAVPAFPVRNNRHAERLWLMADDCKPHVILGTQTVIELTKRYERFQAMRYLATDSLTSDDSSFQALIDITSNTLAFLQYTSGSTGHPKGVMVSHGNILANEQGLKEVFEVQADRPIVFWLPVQHDMGLIGQVLFTIYAGTQGIFMSPASFMEKPIRWLRAISHYQGYFSGAPNFGYQLCVDKFNEADCIDLDLSSWKAAFNGSEPINATTIEAFAQKFARYGFKHQALMPCYGMAETTLMISVKPLGEMPMVEPVNPLALTQGYFTKDLNSAYALVSSGHLYRSFQIKIVNPESLLPTGPGELGEIWLRGPCITQGYWNKPEITEATFHAQLANGEPGDYLRTGDLGYLDGKELYITSRLKDLIIIQGRNLYPQDIEVAVEKSHPAIRSDSTAVFSITVEGEEKIVVVSEIERTARKSDPQEIFSAMRKAVIASAEVIPYSLVLLQPAQALKTTSGKIQRQETKQAYLAGELKEQAREDMPVVTREDNRKDYTNLVTDIQRIYQTVLEVEHIAPTDKFTNLGGDSLKATELYDELQSYLGRSIPLSTSVAFDYPSLAELMPYIESLVKGITPLSTRATFSVTALPREPIAIIGMSCRFPGSENSDAFWELLQAGKTAVGPIPQSRSWLNNYLEEPGYGGFIDNIEYFDASLFNITPREAEHMDPQQRILLEVTWEAFEAAGIAPRSISGSSTGVFMGAVASEYKELLLRSGGDIADAYFATGNDISVIAGRVAYTFGLQGPTITLDTACSSSLVAIHEACKSLHDGECTMALAGGVNALFSADEYEALTKAQMLAPDGSCKTFDKEANGYVRGEGCGVIILKRLSDALRDNDRILAVIKGSAVNQDGASSGLTVPNGLAQEQLLSQALIDAHLTPKDIDYIETHGTGTRLGDPMEVNAINRVFAGSRAENSYLYLGAVKTNIGHLEAAAGIASVIKTILALQHERIPPNLHFSELNPQIDLKPIPAQLPLQAVEWKKRSEHLRRAGISSFGFSGTNAHVILEEAPTQDTAQIHQPLPKIVFNSQRYWPESLANPLSLHAQVVNVNNPSLLQKQLSSPGMENVIFESTINSEWPSFISDHRIYDIPVLAGATHIAVLLSALQQLNKQGCYVVEAVTFEEAAVIASGAEWIYQLVLIPIGENRYQAHIYSKRADTEVWQLHVSALLYTTTNVIFPVYDFNALQNQFAQGVFYSKEEHRERVWQHGLQLEENFLWLEEARIYEDAVFAKMRLPCSQAEVNSFILAPGLIDACFQTIVGLIEKDNTSIYVPFTITRLRYWGPATIGYVYSRILTRDAQGITAEFILFSQEGNVIGDVEGFMTREASPEKLLRVLHPERDISSRLYEIQWENLTLTETQALPEGEWLLLGSDNPLKDALRESLQTQGKTVMNVSVLTDVLNIQDITHIIWLVESSSDIEKSYENQVFIFFDILKKFTSSKPSVHRITTEASGSVITDLVSNAFVSLLRTVRSEYPEWWWQQINLPVFLPEYIPHIEAALAQREEICLDFEKQWRVPRLISATVSNDKIHSFDKEGLYLITGGLGGLGLLVAEYVASQGVKTVMLVGRHLAPEKINSLQMQFPNVKWLSESVDISDENAVKTLFDHIKTTNSTLKGIFHLAGVLDDGVLSEQTIERFNPVWMSKALGAWYLHQYSQEYSLTHFVLFSSIASVLGSAGQSNYAFANGFLDALAHYRQQQDLPALSIDWGPWQETGMAVALRNRLEASGVKGFSNAMGIHILDTLVSSSAVNVMAASINWALLAQLGPLPTLLNQIVQKDSKAGYLTALLQEIDPSKRLFVLKEQLRHRVESVLGFAPGQLDENKGFFDAGMDSLMLVNLRNQLQNALGNDYPLSTSDLFSAATIAQLTTYVAQVLKISEMITIVPKLMAHTEEAIAIIGMSCRLPGGANSPEEFWELLRNGFDASVEVPKTRWDIDAFYDPDPESPGKMYCRKGGFLSCAVDEFDAGFFGISPREVEMMDPQQRLLLEVTWEAFENAGYKPDSLRNSPTGVFMGISTHDYGDMLAESGDANINTYTGTGNAFSAAIGRVSYIFGLQGPCMAIDTACSSSLLATHLACQSLRNGESDLAIAGGVNLMLAPGATIYFCKGRMLSPEGICKTFDASANGYVRGEGCGVIVLKRLSDALKDNDRILALIKGSATNQDGASGGLTVPNGAAQRAVITQALSNANVAPDDIDYIEAHGTGTALGDPIEVQAIGQVFANRERVLRIGSVKTNIGHLEAAAGVSGLLKLILALQHETIPPHEHFKTLNPNIRLDIAHLEIPTKPLPWPKSEKPRRAGISGFAFSGSNVHVILEEAPSQDLSQVRQPLPKTIFNRQRYWAKALDEQNEKKLVFPKDWYLEETWISQALPELVENKTYINYVWVQGNTSLDSHAAQLSAKIVEPEALIDTLVDLENVCVIDASSYLKFSDERNVVAETEALMTRYQRWLTATHKVSRWVLLNGFQGYPASDILLNLAKVLNWEQAIEIQYIGFRSDEINIVNEIARGDEAYVLYQKEGRYVQRIVPADIAGLLTKVSSLEIVPDVDGTYLITGGLGSLGMALLKLLLEMGFKNFILVSRHTPDAAQENEIQELQSTFNAKIIHAALDVSDPVALAALIKSIENLRGVFHLAGIEISTDFEKYDLSQIESVLKPKMAGAWNLHTLTKDLPLRYFVLFSSLVALMGSNRQAPYVLANGYLDSLARYRKAEGLPITAIQWGPWAGGGMALHDEQFSRSNQDYIPLQKGMEAFKQILTLPQVVNLAVTPPTAVSFRLHFHRHLPHWLEKFISVNEEASVETGTFIKTYYATAENNRQGLLSTYIENTLKNILHIDAEQSLDKNLGFFEIGMDSLMAVEFYEHIKRDMGDSILLRPMVVFDYPSLEKITEYLYQTLEGLSQAIYVSGGSYMREPIAVIGLDCRFPGGGEDADTFWASLVEGVDAIRYPEQLRWDKDLYPYKAALLDNIDLFDAQFFGISPREAVALDPQQRLVLETTWHALEGSGIRPESLKGSDTGVFIGISLSDYGQLLSEQAGEHNFYLATGSALNVVSGRLAYLLGLQGPTMAIDTACSSSLVAVHEACRSLQEQDCTLAIAGGVNVLLNPQVFSVLTQGNMLSPEGYCKTFDKDANGYVRGEGCGIIILKRLSDALRDNNKVLAVIKGSAVNQDGASSGLTVPNGLAQEKVLAKALVNADVLPNTVDYIEAHGTGTGLGDPIEVGAIQTIYGQDRKQLLTLGTVKTNIGHLESAAGIAGIIKTILALQHELIPKHLHFKEINPSIHLAAIPAQIPLEPIAWKKDPAKIRRAGVSSFGFSGTNAHMIIEEAPEQDANQIQQALAKTVFNRRHYWALNPVKDLWKIAGFDIDETGHPFLQHVVELPENDELYFESMINIHYPEFIAEHLIYGYPVIAAGTYLSLALSLARDYLDAKICRLQAIEIIEALVIHKPTKLWVKLGSLEENVRKLEIYSQTLEQDEAQLHVTMEIVLLNQFENKDSLEDIKSHFALEPTFNGEQHLAILQSLALRVGPHFQWTEQIYLHENEVLTRLRDAEQPLETKRYVFYPGLVDSFFQSNLVLLQEKDTLFVPVSIKSFTVNLEQGLPRWIYSNNRKVEETQNVHTDLILYDATNKAMGIIEDLVGQQATRAALENILKRQEDNFNYVYEEGMRVRVVVEEAALHKSADKTLNLPFYLFPFSAENPIALKKMLEFYKKVLEENPKISPLDLSYSLQITKTESVSREAFVAADIKELQGMLEDYSSRSRSNIANTNPDIAFLYSDNGKDWINIKDLSSFSHIFAEVLQECNNIIANDFPEVTPDCLFQTGAVDNLCYYVRIFCMQYALTKYWQSLGVNPHWVTGTGVGFYAACVTSKVVDLKTALKLVLAQANCYLSMSKYNQGTVLFISLQEVEQWLSTEEFEDLFIAEIHGNKEIIISGDLTKIQQLTEQLRKKSLRYQSLLGTFRNHREINADALNSFESLVKHVDFQAATIPIVLFNGSVTSIISADDCIKQLQHPFKGFSVIDKLLTLNAGIFVEISTDENIISWGKFYAEKQHNLWLKNLNHTENSWYSLLTTMGELFETGISVNWQNFVKPFKEYSNKIKLRTFPLQRKQPTFKRLEQIQQKISEESKYFYQIQWRAVSISNLTADVSLYKTFYILPESSSDPLTLNLLGDNFALSKDVIPETLEQTSKDINRIVYRVPESSIDNVIMNYGYLLQFIQNAIAINLSATIWLVTSNAYSIDGSLVSATQQLFAGFIKTLQAEHPQLRVKQLDVENNNDWVEVIKWIQDEETKKTEDLIIGYRNAKRYLPHLNPVALPKPDRPLLFNADAYYFITGGLGGLGFSLTYWLAQHGAKHIILIARRNPTEIQNREIEAWKEQGIEIEIVHADVTKKREIESVFHHYKNGLYPIKGIFHLAGMIDDAPVISQTIDRFKWVFQAKAISAWYLHEILEEQKIPVEYFVLFSSLASVNGSPSQSNYAAANAFLDGLAYYRRQQFLPAITLNWGAWAEIGMAKDLTTLHEHSGMRQLKPDKAWELLEIALNANPVQITIADIDWKKFVEAMPTIKNWVTEIYQASENVETIDYLQQLQNQTQEQQLQLLEGIIISDLRSILNIPAEMSIDNNQPFYTMGLDSLMGLQLINRLTEQLNNKVVIKYENVLQKNTIALLAEYIVSQLNIEAAPVYIPKVSRDKPILLSLAQERLWFLQQLEPSSRAYCEISAVEMKGDVDKDLVERVFRQLIQRHESLRTHFLQHGDEALQVIENTVDWHLDYMDLSNLDEKTQTSELENLLTTESLKSFDLTKGDLFRCLLIQISDKHWILTMAIHHIISDGWSIGILIREFALAYNAAFKNETYIFTPLEIQYADYAEWQRRYLTPAVLNTGLQYWQKQLADAELLNLPLDYPRPKMLQDAGSQFHYLIPKNLTSQLKELCRENDVTLYMLLLSALYILLSRYGNQNDVSIGSPVANRTLKEVENVVGFFVNMVVSRININTPVSFIDLLKIVKQISLSIYEHQDTPFEKVVETLVKDRDTSRTALFDVLLVLQNAIFEIIPISNMEVKLKPIDAKIAKFDLTFEFYESEGEIQSTIEYRTHLFKASTIERMAEHYLNILKAFVNKPTMMTNDVDFLGEKEKLQLLTWNDTKHELSKDQTIVQWFETQVEETPNNLALILDDKKLTYRQLNQCANQLAHYLCSEGVGPEVYVALCMDRSIEFVITLLAILKAGGAYLPINPSYPIERIEYILNDSKPLMCISMVALDVDHRFNLIDFHQLELAKYSKDNLVCEVKQNNPAYIIYTSGSTGKPKGVVLTHISLINFMQWLTRITKFVDPMRLLHKTSVGFDVAVSDIFTPLLRGGVLVIAPPGEQYEPEKLLQRIKKYEVTYVEFVPSQLQVFLDEQLFSEELSLQAICVGGEELTRDNVDKYFKQLELPLLNTYGPSECTITATACWIEPTDEIITIGKPLDNMEAYILDKFNNLLPIGAIGELCIGGIGLAREYLNRTELTHEKFITNPFGKLGERLYHTGDLARYLDDGRIEYRGRVDNQIKIRGFRIELGEIEDRLRSFPDILQALVIAKKDENTHQFTALVAYVVTKTETKAMDAAVLRAYLSQTLPEYMVPSYYIFMDKFPLNANGKLDRKQLPQPEAFSSRKTYRAPETELQKTIVNIFSEVLKIETVGINDSFFELGGHSLLAIKVIGALRKALKRDAIPLSILFRCTTPKQIADAIENSIAEQKTDILCLQSKGSRLPLFMVPGSEGFGLTFIDFTVQFSIEPENARPIYTFQYPGLFKDVEIDTLEILANHYIQSLYTIQPEGPYYILGWSMGGIVAYEMAKQLEAQGKEVKLLGIIDITPATIKSEPVTFHELMIRLLFDDRFGVPKEKHTLILQEINTLPEEQLLEYTYSHLRDAGSILIQEGKKQFERIIRVLSDNDQLLRSYVVSDTVNNITYFPAQDSYSFPQSDEVMQCSLNADTWQAWSRTPVNVYPVAGNHFTLWQKPNIQSLVDSIKSWEINNFD